MRRWPWIALLAFGLIVFVPCWVFWPVAAPPLRIATDTTFLLGPLNPDGTVNYVAALNQIMSEGVTPENNAAVDLLRAFGPAMIQKNGAQAVINGLGMENLPAEGDYFVTFAAFFRAHWPERVRGKKDASDTQAAQEDLEVRRLFLKEPGDRLSPDVREPISAWVQANEQPLSRLVQASRKTRFFVPWCDAANPPTLTGAACPNVFLLLEAGKALGLRAQLRVMAGDLDGAWADAQALRRLARLYCQHLNLLMCGTGILLDGYASRIQTQIAVHPGLSTDQARAMLAELCSMPELPSVERAIDLGERCLLLDNATMLMRRPAGAASGRSAPSRLSRSIDFNVILQQVNTAVDSMLAPCRAADYAEREELIRRHQSRFERRVTSPADQGFGLLGIVTYYMRTPGMRLQYRTQVAGHWLLEFIVPRLGNMDAGRLTATMRRRLTEVALALAVWHAEKGMYPTRLENLAPLYLPQIPLDLFAGNPLIYKPGVDGYLLYSLGPNRTDDQGEPAPDRTSPLDDIVVDARAATSQPGQGSGQSNPR